MKQRIALFGNFGSQNIGNECTLEAARMNLARLVPDVELFCIAQEPALASALHGLRAVAIDQAPAAGKLPGGQSRGLTARLRAAASRIPREIRGFAKVLGLVDRWTTLVICGTGVMEDEPANWLFHILKWTVATRLRRGRVVFLSIGAGPVRSRWGRLFCRRALATAQFVSYRDNRSKAEMHAIGVNTDKHRVFPDLAFSIPGDRLPAAGLPAAVRRIAVGVINDHWFADPDRYSRYLATLATFVEALVSRGHTITVIHGDGRYDLKPLQDLKEALRQRGLADDDPRISSPRITTPTELLRQLADVDMVIASRYHNVVLGLVLGRPTIALAYHFKLAALLEEFGMNDCIIELDELDCALLRHAFDGLAVRVQSAAQHIREHTSACRDLLEEQFRILPISDRGS